MWPGKHPPLGTPEAVLTPSLSTVSHSYGYGLLDAGAMVSLAKNWTTVGPQRKCVIDILAEPRYRLVSPGENHSASVLHSSLRASGPRAGSGDNLRDC